MMTMINISGDFKWKWPNNKRDRKPRGTVKVGVRVDSIIIFRLIHFLVVTTNVSESLEAFFWMVKWDKFNTDLIEFFNRNGTWGSSYSYSCFWVTPKFDSYLTLDVRNSIFASGWWKPDPINVAQKLLNQHNKFENQHRLSMRCE